MAYWLDNGWRNLTGAGLQDSPAVVQLGNGNFLVAWLEPIATSGFSNVMARFLDNNGTESGAQFQLAGGIITGMGAEVRLVPAGDGGFYAFWDQNASKGVSTVDYVGQHYDASGQAVGGRIIADDIPRVNDLDFGAIALANGNLVVQWQDNDGAPIFRVLDPNGAPVTSETRVDPLVQSSDQSARHAAIAAAPDGGFFLAWNDASSSSLESTYFEKFDASGHAMSGPFLAINAQPGSGAPEIAVLADGNVVVAVSDHPSPGATEILGAEFTPAGHLAGSRGLQIALGGWQLGDYAITAVPDGGFAVSYSVLTPGRFDGKVYEQRYDSNVTLFTHGFEPRFIGDTGAGLEHSVIATSSGGLQFAWNYFADFAGDAGDIHANQVANHPVPADDTITGSDGIDTVTYAASRDNFNISRTGDGVTVSGFESTGFQATDTLHDIERLHFTDENIALDVDGNAGMAYRLYQAAFDRGPDLGGLGYHIADLDRGVPLEVVAHHFLDSPEFQARYGSLDDAAFVTRLYANILHRSPDPQGFQFHMDELSSGVPRYVVLTHFSEAPENYAALIGVIENGMAYLPG
ncbi:MAG TPA: DUF4214 domain-containing protein [Ramlibacter sp.]|nr:DUF4214 domain-containing protein [Ramlibacter sp.]